MEARQHTFLPSVLNNLVCSEQKLMSSAAPHGAALQLARASGVTD